MSANWRTEWIPPKPWHYWWDLHSKEGASNQSSNTTAFVPINYRSLSSFDHIPRKWLFDTISLRFTDKKIPTMIKILERLYQQTSLTYEEEFFQTTPGVSQGGPESPFILNLYLDFVMRLILEKSHMNDNIKYFDHNCINCINTSSVSRADKLSMSKKNISLSGLSISPWCGFSLISERSTNRKNSSQ